MRKKVRVSLRTRYTTPAPDRPRRTALGLGCACWFRVTVKSLSPWDLLIRVPHVEICAPRSQCHFSKCRGQARPDPARGASTTNANTVHVCNAHRRLQPRFAHACTLVDDLEQQHHLQSRSLSCPCYRERSSDQSCSRSRDCAAGVVDAAASRAMPHGLRHDVRARRSHGYPACSHETAAASCDAGAWEKGVRESSGYGSV